MTESRDQIVQSICDEIRRKSALKSVEFLSWLPGDASNRFYGRLQCQGQLYVLMVMNAPEAFKSEEVTGSVIEIKELPFITVDRGFEKAGVRVPSIAYVGEKSDFILLEDFGSRLLYDERQIHSALLWYQRALDELVKIQSIQNLQKHQSFTRDLLKWETEHFVEYALIKRDKKISNGDLATLRSFFDDLVEAMATSSYCLVHRDFHSKNLMILEQESRIGVIDFQDALWGPPTYDLASLLRDSYVALSDHEEETLLQYFEKQSGTSIDRRLFGLTSLQRNCKAVGRFYYISMVKGRDTHLPYVNPSMKRILKTLDQLHETKISKILLSVLADESR